MSNYVAKRRLAQRRRPVGKSWLEAPQAPFRDSMLMLDPPNCSLHDFETPRLRQCPFDQATLSWESRIGEGSDGCVRKVKFGDDGPLILKVFWDAEPPDFAQCSALQRECQTPALLQTMGPTVEQAAAVGSPILVHANPVTRQEAPESLRAFSDEGHEKQ
ncbi:hypothetical protein MMYC01_206890 [Madurella mycetomatis]|uniref:Uncharacterized protein n=1 Tax=Madurella mycetomatis TaxID=100816 RepID=A0A175VZS6_9PEZI|nr:hypothetical protein MMYC01_206890 [Madurella mycetomatis]